MRRLARRPAPVPGPVSRAGPELEAVIRLRLGVVAAESVLVHPLDVAAPPDETPTRRRLPAMQMLQTARRMYRDRAGCSADAIRRLGV